MARGNEPVSTYASPSPMTFFTGPGSGGIFGEARTTRRIVSPSSSYFSSTYCGNCSSFR